MDYCYSVYPRWRGEHGRTEYKAVYLLGLSPLARGTHVNTILYRLSVRFIPAGAGNTLFVARRLMSISVYPRWRGEHAVQNFLKRFNCGLSPLARGTHRPRTTIRANRRFIPAGAGNTTSGCRRSAWSPVYPRWRGEHAAIIQKRTQGIGLSPLARGTRLNMYIYSLPYPVYPRWRGEHRLCLRLYRWWRGLSPLVRGTPERGAARHAKMRFIPAGAGNTLNITYY